MGSVRSVLAASLASLALVYLARAVRRGRAQTFDRRAVELVGVREDGALHVVGRLAAPRDVVGYCAAAAVIPGLSVRDRAHIAVATGAAASLGHLLKLALPRERPAKCRFDENGGQSFPSTHVAHTTAFGLAIAGVVTRRTGPAVALPTYAAALAMGGTMALSRVRSAAHWPSDVVAGMLVGVAAAALAETVLPR